MSNPTSRQSAADRLVSLGLHPVWLVPVALGIKGSGKAPAGGEGWNAHPWRPVAPAQPHPYSNLGIQTGWVDGAPTCVIVLDCDSPEAQAWADANVPPTPVRTIAGRGEHRYYRRHNVAPGKAGGKVTLRVGDATIKCDVKGDGGQVVCAPSVHFTGHVYSEATEWTPELLARMPTWDPAWVGGARTAGIGKASANINPATLARPGLSQVTIKARVRWALKHKSDFGPNTDADTVRRALQATLDGSTPLATYHRGSALRDATMLLARVCPEATTEQLVEYLTPAIQAMGQGWDTDADWGVPGAHAKLDSARRKTADKDAGVLVPEVSPEDSDTEAPPTPVSQYLIVTHPKGDVAWVRRPDGTYDEPWSLAAVYRYRNHESGLAWAVRQGAVTLTYPGAKGEVVKPIERFLSEYSTPLKPSRHALSLKAQHNTFDPVTGVFTEATCPVRTDLAPQPDAEFDVWLRHFAGPEYSRLVDWLATLTQVDLPTPILAIIGPPNCGKGLLIEGVSRVWHTGRAPDFGSIVGSFNEALAKSPLLIADEHLPDEGPNGADIFDYLREFVTKRKHTVNRKNMPVTQVEGCVRIIYANNKHEGLHFRNANAAAKTALAERFVYIAPTDDAARYTQSVSADTMRRWVESDGIARHCLWLADSHRVAYRGRLLVQGNGNELINIASNSKGATGHLSEALCRFLLDPRVVSNNTRDYFHIEDGQLWVATRAFEDKVTWESLVPSLDGKRYGTAQLGSALSQLSVESARKRYRGARSGTRVQAMLHRIDLAQVFSFAERTGMGHPDTMRATLAAVPTEPIGTPAQVIELRQPPKPETPTMEQLSLPQVIGSNQLAQPTCAVEPIAEVPCGGPPSSAQLELLPATQPASPAPAAPKPARKRRTPEEIAESKKPAWQRPAPDRAPEYDTPHPAAPCPMLEELCRLQPSTEQDTRALCAPYLLEAQSGHPMTYARLVNVQRAYIRALYLPGADPLAHATDAWIDRLSYLPLNAPPGIGDGHE